MLITEISIYSFEYHIKLIEVKHIKHKTVKHNIYIYINIMKLI